MLNAIFRYQRTTFSNLIVSFVLRRPGHIENFVLRTHKFFRVAMTTQTPFHLQRRSLVSNRHLIDATVARRTTDAFVHMNAVIEICVVRKVVNSDPLDWFAGAEALANFIEIRAVRPNLLMAIHAGRGCRHAR